MKMKYIISCFLLITLIACSKVDEDKRPEFFGYWYHSLDGDYVTLNINEKSFGVYTIVWQGYDHSYSGVVRVNDKHIFLGSNKSFEIIEYPQPIDTSVEKKYVSNRNDFTYKLANWKMTLYGLKPSILHVCETWTFYKADY